MLPTGYNTTFMCRRPGDLLNATGTCDPKMDEDLTMASQQKDGAEQHKYLQMMMDEAANNAYFLFWMHDRNLRVMAPEVKGYVHPQSWWVDFTTISVVG
jgi:peptide/nickel transport system substrate-binding protein